LHAECAGFDFLQGIDRGHMGAGFSSTSFHFSEPLGSRYHKVITTACVAYTAFGVNFGTATFNSSAHAFSLFKTLLYLKNF